MKNAPADCSAYDLLVLEVPRQELVEDVESEILRLSWHLSRPAVLDLVSCCYRERVGLRDDDTNEGLDKNRSEELAICVAGDAAMSDSVMRHGEELTHRCKHLRSTF